ncbi:MAG: DUF5924 family protein [Candidatus Latescibacterota bacterium]|jgi:hypothetical protein
MLESLRNFWSRHRSLFWTLHSVWAFAAGVSVIVISHERYEFVPWAILFLLLTWLTTLYFGRTIGSSGTDEKKGPPGLKKEVVSYLTRAMYQQTLFFLLPFYWYSTVVKSMNVVLLVVLAALAAFSCVELVFDRWLRTKPVFGLIFFATVAFAAINLLIPLLVPIDPAYATPMAAFVAIGSAIPLAMRSSIGGWMHRVRFGLACVILLVVGLGLPELVPPVPLRLQKAVFTRGIDRETLVPADTLMSPVASQQVGATLYVIVKVFAPSIVPTEAKLEWYRDGELFRESREVAITAHELGFRIWDGFRPRSGQVRSGRYEVVLRTGEGRVFGRTALEIL